MRLERELAVSAEAAAQARRALDALAATGFPDGRLRDVRLLVSELVTNAVRHATLGPGDVIRLIVDADGGALRVEVHDPGGGFVAREPVPDPERPSGWGLYLVAELADRWGVDSDDSTLVWFEVDRPYPARTPRPEELEERSRARPAADGGTDDILDARERGRS